MPFVFLLISCKNHKIEELYGSWTSENIELDLREDKSMQCRLGVSEISGRFRTFGNSIELINSEEKSVGRIGIKSLKNDTLVIDLIQMSSNTFTLVRKKS